VHSQVQLTKAINGIRYGHVFREACKTAGQFVTTLRQAANYLPPLTKHFLVVDKEFRQANRATPYEWIA
jgi:hypothetical protein